MSDYTGPYGLADAVAAENGNWRDEAVRMSLGEYRAAIDEQIGGDHYKKLKIQPMEYSMANNLNACQHTIIKYVTRYKDKGGRQDLEKARHTIDLLIQMEYPEANKA